MDLRRFIEEFQDYLVPKLDTYEQAVYIYVFRHSRLLGLDEVTIGFKSARKKMAFGIGKKGTPVSEHVIYEKLRSLMEKGCLEILETERAGTRVRLRVPSEVPSILPDAASGTIPTLDEIDFFGLPEGRQAILEREEWRCFYCLRKLNKDNYVMDHVFSRPAETIRIATLWQPVVAVITGRVQRRPKISFVISTGMATSLRLTWRSGSRFFSAFREEN